MKASLEEAARNTNRSVARLLDEIVAERLDAAGQTGKAELDNQRRLHVRAGRFAGRFSGTDPVGVEVVVVDREDRRERLTLRQVLERGVRVIHRSVMMLTHERLDVREIPIGYRRDGERA